MLIRFAYLAVAYAFAAPWLFRMTDGEKDIEILAHATNSLSCNDWEVPKRRSAVLNCGDAPFNGKE